MQDPFVVAQHLGHRPQCLERVGAVSRSEGSIATVLAIFNGVTQGLALFMRVFVSRPLLERHGVRFGVLVLPTLHVLCSVFVVACGLAHYDGLELAGVFINQGLYKVLKHPIDNASFKVLYQPLRRTQRLRMQIAVEMIVAPIVVGVAGLFMLAISGPSYTPARFAVCAFSTAQVR